MTDHVVADADELPVGGRIVVQIEGKEIGVFNVDGEYFAYTNWCMHQAGPVCEGALTGTQRAKFDRETLELELEWTDEGKILNCPWHGWEYDVTTGDCLSRKGVKLSSYPVSIEDGEIVVSL